MFLFYFFVTVVEMHVQGGQLADDDGDDIIYHKYDPEFKIDFTKKLESARL